jgi:mono/diheme cytochrome c family protein
MNRLIIESIEGRITLGITMFVALMILIGWIMINEPARMASFDEQHLGRSIEQGAELFASRCTECHGTNGQGVQGRAPALNNPHLFEYDFTAAINGQVANAQRIIRDAYTLQTELLERQQELTEELGAETISEERAAEVTMELTLISVQLGTDVEAAEARLAELETIPAGDLTEEDAAVKAALETNIARTVVEPLAALEGAEGLLAQRDVVLEQLASAMTLGYMPRLEQIRAARTDRAEALAIADEQERAAALLEWIQAEVALTEYIANDSSRLQQVGWGGDLRGYITTTLIHGRPGSAQVYPASQGGMVSWSQEGGGPLRRDQIDNIVNYIMNFDKGDEWSLADLATVQQFAKLHVDGSTAGAAPTEAVEITQPSAEIAALPVGDAASGESLYGVNGCGGCHGAGTLAPATAGTWTRIQEDRLSEPQFEGWTAEEYAYFSIVHPQAYIVEGFQNLMPPTFGETLTEQQIADLIAYLATQQ